MSFHGVHLLDFAMKFHPLFLEEDFEAAADPPSCQVSFDGFAGYSHRLCYVVVGFAGEQPFDDSWDALSGCVW